MMLSFFNDQILLVFSPHPDDEVIGCGGIIAKSKEKGNKVYVVIASIGALPHYISDFKITKKETRKKETERALNYLNVDDYEILIEDQEKYMKLDTIPRIELVKKIEKDCRLSIENIRPTIVALPYPSFHQDHEALFKAVFTATRPHIKTKKHIPNIILFYESPNAYWSYYNFKPNFYVDISKWLNKKINAYKLHRSQIPQDDIHPLSIKNLENLAKLRGAESGVAAAEAFVCYRMIV